MDEPSDTRWVLARDRGGSQSMARMIIDAHHHFWLLNRGDYGWLTPDMGILYRDFQPADLDRELAHNGVAGTILATSWPKALGVVGWTDLTSPTVSNALERLARHPLLRGIRPMVQDEPDPDWILQSSVCASLTVMRTLGLTFDALVRPRHLKALAMIADRHPDLPIVIDHAAKPEIENGEFDLWASDILALSRHSRIYCKLSGLLSEAGPRIKDQDLRPYFDHLLACFGPRRLMWGSDWPVLLGASGYSPWLEQAVRLAGALSAEEKHWLFYRTAASFYNVEVRDGR
jgi:L-fuconolactonase